MSNNYPTYIALGLALFLPTSHSMAEPGKPGQNVISVGELSRVQSETILLKAEAERAKAYRAVAGETDTGLAAASLAPLLPEQEAARPGTGLPVVKLVYGTGKALRARLVYSGGYEVDASMANADLPEGYRMVKLSLDQVVLARGGKRYSLGFATSPPHLPPTVRPTPPSHLGLPAPAPASLPGGAPAPIGMAGEE